MLKELIFCKFFHKFDFVLYILYFRVRPRGKSWRQIGMTSGGEKTISSLSLVFALHQFLPTPFYVMDEIDAALDYRNVAMISKFVKVSFIQPFFVLII